MIKKSKTAKKATSAAPRKAAKKPATAKQVFSYRAPNAISVLLAGDFTHWQTEAIPMKRGKEGIWKVSVALAPGLHHYRFIVDGHWLDDPECELRVPNPYGGHNSVRTVS
jgi:1,4-alpha-glucan branching enzyme